MEKQEMRNREIRKRETEKWGNDITLCDHDTTLPLLTLVEVNMEEVIDLTVDSGSEKEDVIACQSESDEGESLGEIDGDAENWW